MRSTYLLRRVLVLGGWGLLGMLSTLSQSLKAGTAADLRQLSFHSRFMGEQDWAFKVYLPPGYDTSTKRYPVIYSLHGGGGNDTSNTWTIDRHIQDWIEGGQIPECILVFPNAGPDNFYLDSGVVRNQPHNPDSYIAHELIPFMDKNFRTVATAEGRALTGFSMGGYGTYHFAYKYPELFSAAAPMAAGGPYGPNGQINNYDPHEDPHKTVASNGVRLKKGTRIAVAVGGQDLVDYNNEMVRLTQAQGIPVTYDILPGVGHNFEAIMAQRGLKIFQFITEGFKGLSTTEPMARVIRIKAGSNEGYIDSRGAVWSSDGDYVGGQTVKRDQAGIANTSDPKLYQSERFGMNRYVFPEANGHYQVYLHFAETYAGIKAPGQRVFDVDVEGSKLDSLDIFREAGGRDKAIVKSFQVAVEDRSLDITFRALKDQPLVNAIEVVPLD